jgi:hypothetical protein
MTNRVGREQTATGRFGAARSKVALATAGLAALFLVTSLAVAANAHLGGFGGVANSSVGPNKGGGCPSSNAIGNFLNDTNLSAIFSIDGTGTLATYTISSDNESPSGGVPGLIEYCVYPAGAALPNATSASALGDDGTPFVVTVGTHQGFFSFGRGGGNPTNLPFDGAQNVVMGNASWTAGVPTGQTIVLHINNQGVCSGLYGGSVTTCFVKPGPSSARCSAPGMAPFALKIPLGNPATAIPSGGTLTAQYELQVQNFTTADLGAVVHIPSVTIHFPESPSGNLTFFILAHQVTITGSGWSLPIGYARTMNNSTSFSSHNPAWLSTANLGVTVANGPANLTLEFSWGWIANRSGPTTQMQSTPSATATLPWYPSIFVAPPFVSVLSMSNTTATAGSFFGITLGGAVNSTSFRTVVEDLQGKELHCVIQSNPHSGVSSFTVGIPLTYVDSTPLAPGKYLIHVHDEMGAIVAQIAVQVV